MFMGDASITTEKEILDKYNLSNIDVLKVGHHGSKTSSGKEFINEINPKCFIISVGKDNRIYDIIYLWCIIMKKKTKKIIIFSGIILAIAAILLMLNYLKHKNDCCSCCQNDDICISVCCKCKGAIFK